MATVRESLNTAVDQLSGNEPGPDRLQDYLDAISAYEREFKKWEGRVDKILKRYRDEQRDNKLNSQSRFNILWSNVQTLVPACFSKLPKPDVSRRFRDDDPVGRVAALILERALEFEVQHYPDFEQTMRQSVQDRFLGGRGSSWARYDPHFKAMEGTVEDDVQITEDVESEEAGEQIDYECAPTDYVAWKDFGHSVARTWEEVTLVWRKVYMSENAVKERFGEETAKKIPYDATPEDLKRRDKENANIKKQACIYELADKETGKFVWLSKSVKSLLDERADPLKLHGFFPCPIPLYATITNESLIPVPDFTLYQDQANTLDILSDRIDGLVKMLQLKGVYDGSADSAIARLFTEGENGALLPVKNWAAFAEKNGLKGQVDVLDLTPIANALKVAYEAMEQAKNQVYEITGISDVIRGQTQASETATAQKMKGQFASLRLRDIQKGVAKYATDVLRLKAQIICQQFSPQTIAQMAAVDQLRPEDQQLLPQALALLIGEERMMNPQADSPNPLKAFRIEVASDTMVELDDQTEKQDRMEMLTAFGAYLEKAAQVGAMAPPMVPLIIELGKFGIQAFKVGKAVEGAFDTALDQLKMAAQQAAAEPPPPDPKLEAEKVKAQAAAQKAQLDIGVAKQKAQIDERKMQMEEQHDMRQMAMDQQQQQMQMGMDMQRMNMEGQNQEKENAMKQDQMRAQHEQKMKMAAQAPKRPQ